MKYDFNRSLSFTREEARILMAQVFGLNAAEQEEFLKNMLPNSQTNISYEDLMRESVLFYTCDVFFRGNNK